RGGQHGRGARRGTRSVHASEPEGGRMSSSDDAATEENRLIGERRAKLAAQRRQGIAYPNDFRRDALAHHLTASYAARDAAWLEANPVRVRVAGRMMAKRVMGRASFAKLADRSGQIQLF